MPIELHTTEVKLLFLPITYTKSTRLYLVSKISCPDKETE